MTKVIVGLSGGVDSSVAAYLLKKQGYDVIGLFMKNWHDDTVTISDECPWLEDSHDAMIVAQKLDIPFQTIDLSEQYKSRIVDYMFSEYKAGRTPNPDVLCNREIKFDIFLNTALELGADFVATGHYCRKDSNTVNNSTVHRLLAGKDPNKDQSYFLCQLNQDQLSKALFPIGKMLKPEVRELAKKLDLITAEKKDSQGLCFIGKVRLPEFLQQQLQPKKGQIIEIPSNSTLYSDNSNTGSNNLDEISTPIKYSKENGKIVGEHNGAHYFTIGQRKGMNVGGTPEPLFVIATDVNENIIYTGQGEQHPGLHRPGLLIKSEDIHWIRPDLQLNIGDSCAYMVRIRYRQPLEEAILHMTSNGLYIVFKNLQKGIAAGQFAAWYNQDELIGSGVIA